MPSSPAGIRIAALAMVLASGPRAQVQPAVALEHGMASWYGGAFSGQRAASGELYDEEQLTAAHRTLPFGARVLVRRLDSGVSLVVRINDRGPYVASRVIDLSYAAARRLGMTDPGLVPVSLEVLDAPPGAALPLADSPPFFTVQAGTFRNPDNARRTRVLMEEKYGEARITTVHHDGELWRVLVGRAGSRADADALADAIRSGDRAFQSAFVVRIDPGAAAGD